MEVAGHDGEVGAEVGGRRERGRNGEKRKS